VRKTGNAIKHGLLQNSNLFESLNFRYFGPVDGHDIEELIRTLRGLKDIGGPKLLHIKTTKGKGYAPAEADPAVWHAPGRFDVATGERVKSTYPADRYQDVFGQTLLDLAHQNDKIVGITPAMPSGCSMNIMMNAIPERTFDVGIAEGHAVTFSAGLAKEGMMPFCNIYSSFMQRAYDNVIHDVALQNLNVVFCLDRAGVVGNDGATHQGQFDLTMFRCIPNMTIGVPRNEHELRNLMYTAQLDNKGPFMIRYPRGKGILADWKNEMHEIEIGKGEEMRSGSDVAIIGVGPILYTAQKAIERLETENSNLKIGLYDLKFLKPMDNELLHEIGKRYSKIYQPSNCSQYSCKKTSKRNLIQTRSQGFHLR
jgi:1-deoxy-D-xylulose-5-phosphate synthase